MREVDVLIVGGGPAGSSCAWGLRESGLEVLVVDRAVFPRHKTCAGWVTPPVWGMLSIDRDTYAAGRTFQPITGFKTGLLGGSLIETNYDDTVSYGIRRCEFDHYLLQRCGAELMMGAAIRKLTRDGQRWVVNDAIMSRVLVGAGGNFCPVARSLGFLDRTSAAVVTAQEVEFEVSPEKHSVNRISERIPELFFCDDLDGYGWCFRKGSFLNIGLGHTDPKSMKSNLPILCDELRCNGTVTCSIPRRLHGHAYRLGCNDYRPVIADGVLLVGDAAGLADPHSGEGIRPAVESGLAAAKAILESDGDYGINQLRPYEEWIRVRDQSFGKPDRGDGLATRFRRAVGRSLLRDRWFTRRVLLDRWFLHR